MTALVPHLISNDVPSSEFSELQAVVDAVAAGGAVERIWNVAATQLEDFAVGKQASREPR